MKIALGSKPYDGPWGGGNRFAAALAEGCRQAGHEVVYDLDQGGIDIILLTDPRVRSPNVAFGAGEIFRSLLWKNRRALVIHRVNECDERKNEPFINHRLVRANTIADATVFVGEWLTRLDVWRKAIRPPWSVIHNGADQRIFHARGFGPWTGHGPLKLVTHHWGFHPMKGFDIYRRIDEMLVEPRWKDRLAFTYIGNLPKGFVFENAHYIEPLDGEDLARELRRHHAYVTGSQNEPGGNHQNEGALSGLPLLCRQSGCMPEYCQGFAVFFYGVKDFEGALDALMVEYPVLVKKMPQYPHTADRMVREWLELFDTLLADRAEILAQRTLWRNPVATLLNQFPI